MLGQSSKQGSLTEETRYTYLQKTGWRADGAHPTKKRKKTTSEVGVNMMAVSGRSTPLKNVSGSLRKGCWNTTIQIRGSTQGQISKMWLIATAKMKTMWRSLPTSWTSFKKKSIHIEPAGGTSFRGAKACLLKGAINSTVRVSGLYPASSGFESLMAYQLAVPGTATRMDLTHPGQLRREMKAQCAH